MTEKNIKSRITHKHDTEANWQLAVNFIPKQGEIIVYDEDENYNYSRFKIGNGVSNVNDLPFSGEGEKVYKQNEEPTDAPIGALWIDTNETGSSIGVNFPEGIEDGFLRYKNGEMIWEVMANAEEDRF